MPSRCGKLLVLLALFGAAADEYASAGPAERPRRIVGIVYDGPPPDQDVVSLERFLDAPRQIREETIELTRRDFDVQFPAEKRLTGDWTLPTIRAAIERLLADPEVDLILTLGVFGSTEVCRRGALAKPVIAPFAVDATAQALPLDGDSSGVHNLNYVIRRGNVVQDLVTFKTRLLDFERLHVLVDALFVEQIPELPRYVAALDRRIASQAVLVPVGGSADDALAALDDAEAVYVTPLLRLPAREFDRLVAGLIERRLASFSLQGEVEVRRGILAGLRHATDTSRLARRVALNIQRVLLGDDPANLPVVLDQPERLMINRATAHAVGVYPRWRVALEADFVDEDGPLAHPLSTDAPLTLAGAVSEAVEANLGLAVADRRVAVGEQDVERARAALRPRVDATATGRQLDPQVASVISPERTGSASIDATQLLYSDAARANVGISRLARESLEWQRAVERLDVAAATATAFLNVLRAQTLERVEQDNLRLTESNLDLARKRESIGFSGPADVYRWESALATARSSVLEAHSRVHTTYAVLNRLLHRPLEELYTGTPPPVDDPGLVTGFGRLDPYIDNVVGFEILREFSVVEGLARAPELKRLDASIAAERRRSLAAQRSFWAPDVSLHAGLARDFTRDGVGSVNTLPPDLFTGERDSWSVGLTATLPLYSGGARRAALQRSSAELGRLRIERHAAAEALELRIRMALFAISATYPKIELAEEAAAAARKNLELVQDAYSRGIVSIIDLVDAQNAAQVADAFASNAVYDFLIDLMELQRATGSFDFFQTTEAREAWFRRLAAFFEAAGYTPRRGP